MFKGRLQYLFMNRYTKIKGFLCLFVGIFLFGSLASYNPFDPSYNKASGNDPSNIFGSLGSFFADPLLQFVGFAAFIPAILLISLAYRHLFKGKIKWLGARFLCLIIATFALAAIASSIDPFEKWPFYVGLGGFWGDLIYRSFTAPLTIYGYISVSSLVFLICFCFSSGIRKSEVKKSYIAIRETLRLFVKYIYISASYFANLMNKVRNLRNQRADPTIKKKITKKESKIVEIKKKPVRKKRSAVQASLKLSSDQFELPDFELLTEAPEIDAKSKVNQRSLEQNAKLLAKVLNDFGVKGNILKVRPGPVVTLYELEPSPGTKSARVIGLADDIARSMSAISARISVIPGRNLLGIELPNVQRETVYLRELMETEEYRDPRIKLPIALGKDIGGDAVMTDLSRMPHLLIAGTTGSGKSVAVNAMILSYLYRLSPDECKFIMIDPKMLELSVYEGIPHLLAPVVTEPGKAVVALKWAVREIENRYRLMSNLGVRNISGYNKRIEDAIKKGDKLERTVQTGFNPATGEPIFEKQPLEMIKLPFIVIIVDEMADLMLTAGKDIESSIQRLAQMARAAGIHMVMATQRPSVDVITGVIKANFPTRISFQVTSRIDSRTILGEMGAEQLLGMGDMLYMAGGGRVTRVHGPFVGDAEVDKVVKHLRLQGKPSYVEDITKEEETTDATTESNSCDDLYDQAVAIVLRDKKASISYVQRQLKIGYNRAANIIEKMEQEGVLSQANHAGKREILLT